MILNTNEVEAIKSLIGSNGTKSKTLSVLTIILGVSIALCTIGLIIEYMLYQKDDPQLVNVARILFGLCITSLTAQHAIAFNQVKSKGGQNGNSNTETTNGTGTGTTS